MANRTAELVHLRASDRQTLLHSTGFASLLIAEHRQVRRLFATFQAAAISVSACRLSDKIDELFRIPQIETHPLCFIECALSGSTVLSRLQKNDHQSSTGSGRVMHQVWARILATDVGLDLFHPALELGLRKIAIIAVDCLQLTAVNCDHHIGG